MIELGKMRRGENDGKYEAEPLDEADVFVWRLKLLAYDPKSADPAEAALGKDLKARGMDGLELRMIFEDGPGGTVQAAVRPHGAPAAARRLRARRRRHLHGDAHARRLVARHLDPRVATSVRAMMLTGHPRLATTSKAAREPEYSLEGARRDFAPSSRSTSATGGATGTAA